MTTEWFPRSFSPRSADWDSPAQTPPASPISPAVLIISPPGFRIKSVPPKASSRQAIWGNLTRSLYRMAEKKMAAKGETLLSMLALENRVWSMA